MRITNHCISRVVQRTQCPFDFDGICEQIMVLLFSAGCTMKGPETVKTTDGTFVLEDGVVITFLEPGWRPWRAKHKPWRDPRGSID